MVVAHMFSLGGAMSNPFEFREVMKAQFQLNTNKTVEQVQAEQEARHAERNRARPSRGKAASPTAVPTGGAVPKAEMSKLMEMLGKGKQAQPVTSE